MSTPVNTMISLPQPSATEQSQPAQAFDPMNPSTVTPPPPAPVQTMVMDQPSQVVPAGSDIVTAPVTQQPVNTQVTPEDQKWLTNLINGTPQTDAKPEAQPLAQQSVNPSQTVTPVAQAATAATAELPLPDFIQPHVEFMPNAHAGVLPNVGNIAGTEATPNTDNSEMGQIKKMLQDLQGNQQETEQAAQFQTQVDEAVEALKLKYGSADPKLMEEFGDIFNTFRAQFGQEFGTESARTTLELKNQITALQSQVKGLMDSPSIQQNEPQVTETNIYRNTLASAIPDYQGLVESDYFKQLLATPVDPHNPQYTYNHKLGNMYRSQQTQDIMQFFSDVRTKLSPTPVPNQHVVVDAGIAPASSVSQNSLTTEKLQDVLTKVMNGELKVSEEDMLKLRMMNAKLANKSN